LKNSIKGTDIFPENNILLLNNHAEEAAAFQKICRAKGNVSLASSLEQAFALLTKKFFNTAVICARMANYSHLRGLFKPNTSIIITGATQTELRRIARGWPHSLYVDTYLLPYFQEENTDFIRILETALDYSSLHNEVIDLRKSQELNKMEMDDAFLQIAEIKNVIENSVVTELERRISLESKYIWIKQEKQKIEHILKKLYLANDVTSLIDVVYDIKILVKASSISFYLLDENDTLGKYLKPLVWDDSIPSHEDLNQLTSKLDPQDFAASTVITGQDVIFPELLSDNDLPPRYSTQLKFPLKNILSVPIKHDKEVIGTLEVYNKSNRGRLIKAGFTNEDKQILHQLSEHISIAITKLNLIQYDALTGLLRPFPFFEKVIQKLKSDNKRHQEEQAFSLIMGDVDWFKNYNDRNGHEAGNRALQQLANTLKSSIREGDLLCRYGGEEFLFFLSGIKSKEETMTFAERTRKNIEDYYFINQEHQPRNNLTMSFGITFFTKADFDKDADITHKDLQKLVEQADLAMAEAKGKISSPIYPEQENEKYSEKNRICVFRPSQRGELARSEDSRFKNFPSQNEKRSYPRYLTSNSVILKNEFENSVTRTLNLSLGGLKIQTNRIVPKEEKLTLTLILGKKAFDCTGYVVYSYQENGDMAAFYTGVKFLDLTLNKRQILEKYVSSLAHQASRTG